MTHIITTFAHGNGPYSRTIDLALAVNQRLKEKMPIVVPLVYGDRQKKIIQRPQHRSHGLPWRGSPGLHHDRSA